MKRGLWIIVLLCALLPAVHLSAVPCRSGDATADSLEVSLLTCSPGKASYELYGHTALRVRNLRDGSDWVFNYGMFDFHAPHFVWRFVLGQTDYYLGAVPFQRFVHSYLRQGRGIEAQVLALRPDEALRVWTVLVRTASLEDWTYRYSFLYDNCTTRAVDVVERALDGRVEWPAADSMRTFRTIIHEFSASAAPWNSFGQDLLLGAEVDAPTGVREQMFSPVYAARFFDGAVVTRTDGSRRLLVARRYVVMQPASAPASPSGVGPLSAAVLLLVLAAGVAVWEQRRRKTCLWFDYPFMLLLGGAGCIVSLLFFCSEHPAVDSNRLIVLLNPLWLLYIPVKWRRERGGRPDKVYHAAMAVTLAAYGLLAAVSPQRFPAALDALALLLLVRTVNVWLLSRRTERKYATPAADDEPTE